MSTFQNKISLDNFSIENLDLSDIESISDFLPKNGVIDLNIAEQGLIATLEGQNLCQEKISQVELWISYKEAEKNLAWSEAALNKARHAGHNTVKAVEWFAQADGAYIEACNELTRARACKKWLENKANYFSGWHYTFKTFLRRDYSLETLGSMRVPAYNVFTTNRKSSSKEESFCGDIDDIWGDSQDKDPDVE